MPPPDCEKCGAQPVFRKICRHCGENIWVLAHGQHYMNGANEVTPCACNRAGSKRCDHLDNKKQQRMITRATGKVFQEGLNYKTTPEMAKKAAEGLARGMSPRQALLQAGFGMSTANSGRRGINKMVRAELKTLGRKYIEIGRDLSPEDQEAMVRGRLAENTIIGTDKGVLSAKQLGADKRVAMWQPDSQVGMVILQAPPIPVIEHEVEWMETKGAAIMKLQAKKQEENEPEEGPPPESEPPEEQEYEEEEKKAEK